MKQIIEILDRYLEENGCNTIGSVEANALLASEGILDDNDLDPGFPLRQLLRAGKIPHAYQPNGYRSRWLIPHSSRRGTEE
jgi:hypothetical protein